MVLALVKWLLPSMTDLIQAFVLCLSAFFIFFYFPTLFKLLRDPEVLEGILEENLKLAKMALCCYTIFSLL